MPDSPTRSLDRLGALSGVAAVALLISILMFIPAPPAADEPIADIAQAAAEDKQMLLIGDYLGVLMGGAWLLFGVAVADRLRRSERSGGWWMVALAGITASTAVGLLGNLFDVVFIRAVGHGLTGDALWTVYFGDLVGFVQGIPLALFMLGAGMGTRATGVFPRWTGIVALAAVPLLAVGVASVAGREVDGSPFILPLMLAYLGMLVWTVAVCAVLWRNAVGTRVELAASTA